MHIALTGVSGFLGSAIARHLHGVGHTVTGLVRETSRRDHVEPFVERFVVGDQADESCWGKLLDGADCIVHNSVNWQPLKADLVDLDGHLRSNLDASIRFLHASAPRQFVFLSTIAVHHDMLERERAADGTNRVDEDHPLRPSRLYGAYKASMEAHLWAEHFGGEGGSGGGGRHTSAVRPCAVYGVDPNLERSHGYKIVRALQETGRCDRAGGGKFVHVDDVAAVVGAIVGNDAAAGRPFNLVDCYARHADWAQMAADLLGIKAEIDTSSPMLPKNSFSKTAVESLGVRLDRGHNGIREVLGELISAIGRDPGKNILQRK